MILEGSDIETLGPENGGADSITDPTEVPMILEDDQLSHALEQGGRYGTMIYQL